MGEDKLRAHTEGGNTKAREGTGPFLIKFKKPFSRKLG